jgi:hypothetical protein
VSIYPDAIHKVAQSKIAQHLLEHFPGINVLSYHNQQWLIVVIDTWSASFPRQVGKTQSKFIDIKVEERT